MDNISGNFQTYKLVSNGMGMTMDINDNGRIDIGEPSLVANIMNPNDLDMVMSWGMKGSVELTGKELRDKFAVTFNPSDPKSPRIPFGKAFDVEDASLKYNFKENTGEITFKKKE